MSRKNTRNVRPVSYTHLDVYKRQAAQRAQAQIADLLQQVERKTAEIADQRALNANLLRISRERANADRGPVSYTHLDVYKRQGTYRVCCRDVFRKRNTVQNRQE